MARSAFRTPKRLILDSGAVIALSRGEARARAHLVRALELEIEIEIPVVVVAETLRGRRREAATHRVLKAVDSVPAATEAVGRTAGALLGRYPTSGTVDAMVVAQALEAGGADILTGDRRDLEALAARHHDVRIVTL